MGMEETEVMYSREVRKRVGGRESKRGGERKRKLVLMF